jgi:DNA-binding transcriptional LysR family regulator
VDVILELGSNEAIKEAVTKGLGVSVLSSMAVQKELASGQLRSLRVSGLSLQRTMYVVWDTRRVLPAPARIFLQFLEAASDFSRPS